MSRRRRQDTKVVLQGEGDPLSLASCMHQYLQALREQNYADTTVINRESHLRNFIHWCEQRGLLRPSEINRPMLERYRTHLFYLRKPKSGRPLSVGAQFARLASVRAYFKWLSRQHVLLHNPASELELPKLPKRLPRDVLTPSEVEAVLGQPDVNEPLGLRDRAMLETFYSTGIRRNELLGLSLYDVDLERGTVQVRAGKGDKDRVVPIGQRASRFIERYLREVRPMLAVSPDEGELFLSAQGETLDPARLSRLVRDYVEQAGIGKQGSCHALRHAMATAMLEGGADIRYIQVILGHAKLETTAIYTRVSIGKLKQVHAATHPAARLEPRAPRRKIEDSDPEPTASELLFALAAEGGEEAESFDD